jgi:hypothetical protein
MNYSVAEFRKNIRVALDAVERGELVCIKRHDKTFILLTMSDYNEAIVSAAKDGISRLVTDEVSSNIRPDIPKISLEPSAHIQTQSTPPGPNEFAKALDASEQECCRKKAPCKHWQFEDGLWINSLSGRSREVDNG